MQITLMKMTLLLVATLAASVTLSASTFTFDIEPNSSSNVGAVEGTVTLADNCNPCSASSIVFTQIPTGLTLTGDATTWTDQVANTFYAPGGVLTSFQFLAALETGGGNFQILCWNNILGPKNAATNPQYAPLGIQCPTGVAEAEDFNATTLNKWVEDDDSLFGVSLNGGLVVAPHNTGNAPEPASWSLCGIGLAIWAVWKRKHAIRPERS